MLLGLVFVMTKRILNTYDLPAVKIHSTRVYINLYDVCTHVLPLWHFFSFSFQRRYEFGVHKISNGSKMCVLLVIVQTAENVIFRVDIASRCSNYFLNFGKYPRCFTI